MPVDDCKKTQNERKIASWNSQKGDSKFKLKLRIFFLLLICKPRRRVVVSLNCGCCGRIETKINSLYWGSRCHGNIMGREKECKVPASQKRGGLVWKIINFTKKHPIWKRKNPRQIKHAYNLLIFTHNSLTLEHELNLIIIENHLKIALSSSAA